MDGNGDKAHGRTWIVVKRRGQGLLEAASSSEMAGNMVIEQGGVPFIEKLSKPLTKAPHGYSGTLFISLSWLGA